MKLAVSRDGPVVTVSIERPERRNAVDPETALALRRAFVDFERDESAAVAILTGAGGYFCAGWDLKSFAGSDHRYEPEGEGPLGPTRTLPSKPVIAAVEGHAVAGGLELALWCDLRVASATAVFGVFCRRWGVPLVDGGTVRLPRLIGHSRALDMILTGRPVALPRRSNGAWPTALSRPARRWPKRSGSPPRSPASRPCACGPIALPPIANGTSASRKRCATKRWPARRRCSKAPAPAPRASPPGSDDREASRRSSLGCGYAPCRPPAGRRVAPSIRSGSGRARDRYV